MGQRPPRHGAGLGGEAGLALGTVPLSSEEIERYARHIVLHGIGGPGQQKLKAARVLVIGAGGLGSPLIQYLAAAGIGEIGIVDDDAVSLSNLQRQVLHGTSDIGRPKVESATDAVARLNPHVKVSAFPVRLTAEMRARWCAAGMSPPMDPIILPRAMPFPTPAFTSACRW